MESGGEEMEMRGGERRDGSRESGGGKRECGESGKGVERVG